MKYILLASLLSSAALAAPYAQQGNRQQGQRPQGQAGAQGVQGAQGQAGAATPAQGQAPARGQAGAAAPAQGQAGTAAPAQGQAPPPPAGGAASTTPQDLPTAVSNWMADTSMVSNFLNTGAAMTNDTAFKAAALVAFNAEVDELTHKAIIESQIGNDPTIQGANSTLAGGGAFQDVVDKLMLMSMMGKAAVANIDLINQNRCTNVLPNIDAYMAATGSQSQAVRPIVCDQTGIAGGVQGNGPTVLGQTPGTPQAAFTAAQQLAAGTGNGIVNGGAAQAGAATPAQGQAGAVPAQGQAGAVPAQGQAGAATPAQGQAPARGQAGAATPAQGQAGAAAPARGQAGAAAPAAAAGAATPAAAAPAAGAAKAKGKKNNKAN